MNDVISRISSYQIFNNLVPGAIFSYFLSFFEIYVVASPYVVVDFIVYYFIGLVISRVGSLILGPVLKRIGIARQGDYAAYLRASQKDPALATMLELVNQFRTMAALMIMLIAALILQFIVEKTSIPPQFVKFTLVIALAILFLAAYHKQNSFIKRRVEHYGEES